MVLFDENGCCDLYIEHMADPGIVAIAKKLVNDIQRVSGKTPVIIRSDTKKQSAKVIIATLGQSSLLEDLCKVGVVNRADLEGKREVYLRQLLDADTLLICGSDKRGTIYGIFSLSEYIGVSPLHFWGDAYIQPKEYLKINNDINYLSKEPSIRYRGFFINDEWPCFGNWAVHHYGGFTAEMYDKVFELLLRLKGNYLWPAMWSSSFALDGPGEESAKLADLYGVIMGNSHHEPLLRASEEWDVYKGADTPYGSEWNYVTNKDGLLAYWRDGLARSGKYENIITIGMRGERDSKMQGTTTLAQNIEVLKEIITEQKRLIRENYEKNGAKEEPLLLAIYKEVEQYYYGDDTVPGLKDWDGLSDVILMFCEDNYGHMRFLPEKEHSSGYGMYYHLDYHGEPISYEWINSTPLSAIWEQMTIAYEYGIKEVWMVNVGDLKGNEFPLSYFMELAYDYEKWGSTAVNQTMTYTKKWIAQQFGGNLEEALKTRLAEVLNKGVALIGRHRPEALSSMTYHPYHYREADRVQVEVEAVLTELEELARALPKELITTYQSILYDTLKMGLNLIQMQIYAGKNMHDAMQKCILADRELVETATSRQNGKWYGMYTGSHVGFKNWTESENQYPSCYEVELLPDAGAKSEVSEISSILAEHFEEDEKTKELLSKGKLLHITNYGLCGSGVKAAPFHAKYKIGEGPSISYQVMIPETAWYQIELWLAPSNPVKPDERFNLTLRIDGEEGPWRRLEVFHKDYRAGEAACREWADAVLNQIRKIKKRMYLTKGVHTLEVGFLDGILLLEKLLIYPEGIEPKISCMGPEETWKKS